MKKYIFTIIFIVSVAISSIFTAPTTAAGDIDWISKSPTTRVDDSGDVCNKTRASVINFSLMKEEDDICVTYGKDIDVAYIYNSWMTGMRMPIIRKHGDSSFSFVHDNSDDQMLNQRLLTDAHLIPNTDRVIYTDKNLHRVYPPIVIDDNFFDALVPTYSQVEDDGAKDVLYYTFDLSSVDDILMPSDAQGVNGMQETSYQVSGDGRYIIAYVDNAGVVKYDLETHQVKGVAILPHPSPWDLVNLPRVEAISDDSRFVFMAPEGQIIDTKDCGDTNFYRLSIYTRLTHPCGIRENSELISSISAPYARIQGARFSADGRSLYFLSVTNTDDGNQILHRIVMDVSDSKQIKYLALGDSYSSGEGDVSYSSGQTNYLPGTESADNCHVSYRSYPFLLREKWGLDFNDMKSIACSGAHVVSDYYGDGEYIGQHRELESKSSDEKLHMRSDALSSFAPGIVRQIDFVSKYKPDTVTLTGGGNDVGFGEVIEYCADPQQSLIESCPQVSDPQIVANLRRKIDDEREPMTEFIKKIKEVSPATKVYLIGYPQFVALEGCNDGSILLNKAERLMIRSSVTRLNNILKLVARDTDVYYVDIEDSLEGGQVCQLNSFYMTGPLKVLGKVALGHAQEAYHPNANGHKKIADIIDARIKDNDLSYTIIDIPAEENGQRMVKMAVTRDYAGVGSEQTITMDAGMFEEDGSVDAVMYSNKVPLAKIKVQHDGTLSAKVKIPPEIEPGMHLLTLTGKSVAGDIVQVQQYITIYSNNDGFGVTSAKSSSLLSDTSSNGFISNEAAEPLLQTIHQKPSIGLGQVVNYEKADNQYTVIRHIFMIPVTIILIIVIIVKGTLYVRKKER